MRLKIIALMLVFLIVDSSFIYADYDPFEKIERGIEETVEDLSTFEATDIIINVDSYQPTVLQEQAFETDQPGGYPIVATLKGMKTNPIMDLQKIDYMRVRPTGRTTDYVRSIIYKKPRYGYFDLDNMGYLVIRLKNLKEDEVPKRLDINMTADIIFEIKNGFGVTEQDLVLPIITDEDVFLNEKSKYGFYSGRGYVRLVDIKRNTANFIVYDGRLYKTSVSVKEGTTSSKRALRGGVPYLFSRDEEDLSQRNVRNTYRIRLDYITGNKDVAKVEMFVNGKYKLADLVEGQYIYPGSQWKVRDIKVTNNYDEVDLINEETKERKTLRGGKFYVPKEDVVKIETLNRNEFINYGEFKGFGNLILSKSDVHGVDPLLVTALIKRETGGKFDPNLKGEKGEIGLMQILPSTGEDIANELKISVGNIESYLIVPENNIEFGVYYLKQKLSNFKEISFALAAYNGGDKANDMSEKEGCEGKKVWECEKNEGYKVTRDYVKNILEYYEDYKKIFYTGKSVVTKEDKEEEIDKKLNLLYKKIKEELNNIINTKTNNFNGIKLVLERYKNFLDDVKRYNNIKIFTKYRALILDDIKNLDEAYRDNKEIIDGITAYVNPDNFNFEFDSKPIIFEDQTSVEESSYIYYFNEAIRYYRKVVEDYPGAVYPPESEEPEIVAMDAQLKIAEIYDRYLRDDNQAIVEYKKLLSLFDYPEKDVIENRINFLETFSIRYKSDTINLKDYYNFDFIEITLYNVEKARSDNKAKISIDGVGGIYSYGDDVNEGNKLGDTGWYLKEINADNVLIVKRIKDRVTFDVKESSPERLEKGKQKILPDLLGKDHTFVLEDVNIKQEAHITILPGEEKLTTKSIFMLHIPVEPRLWKLSTEQMNEHINFTKSAIDTLNNYINIIEGVYKWWSVSCYSTFAILWIKNLFWFGAKDRNLARKTVMASWMEDCEIKVKEGNYPNVFECIKKEKNAIDKDLDEVQKAYSIKDYNSRVKKLATLDFNTDRLENKYNSEVFDVLEKEAMQTITSLEGKVEAYGKLYDERDKYIEMYGIDKKEFDSLGRRIGKNIDLSKISEKSSTTVEISESQIKKVGDEEYYFIGEEPYSKVFKDNGGQKYYIDSKNVRHDFKEVPDNVKSEPSPQKAITLLNKGKCKNRVDRLSVDSRAYLRISKRGADCLPLEVELWERYSEFGLSDDLPLNTEKAYRRMSAFSLEDCRRGSTSDRIDILTSLKEDHKNLEKACRDLIDVNKQSALKDKKAGENIKGYVIEYAAQETGGLQCFDIMSIGDCLTLFSVCDPVMCPVSRFTAGGKWNVDNVVSTGIFGSIFLGSKLWDLKRVPPEIGVCVPGIDAGLKNYRSLLQGYQECLIARRDKGENVGICDIIRNIGVCKILWREGTAFFSVGGGALDSLLGIVSKESGGGEYGFFQSNIQKTGEFLNFFTKEYATTYFSAYRGASTDEIGEELCKAAIYGKIPGRGNLLDQLTKPEGPVQFIGWFTELPHLDVAGDLTSDYEVYYHIYAGEDREQIRYYVYLKDLDDLSRRLYITRSTGYLNRGDFVDETVRRVDVTGYDELCIVIDYQEHCGFSRVSSDLLLDYLEDKSLEKSLKPDSVKNERECIGDSTVFNNLGASSIVDAFYPNIGRSGLMKVCGTENPGKGVSESGWKDIGTCGNNSLGQDLGRCWVNKQSYLDALSEYDIQRRNDAERLFKEISEGLLNDKEIMGKIKQLIDERELNLQEKKKLIEIIKNFTLLETQTLNIDLIGKINFEIGETYYELALLLLGKKIEENALAEEGEKKGGETGEEQIIEESVDCEFEYIDKSIITKSISFKYSRLDNKWYWKESNPTIFSGMFGQRDYKVISEDDLKGVVYTYDDILRKFLEVNPNYEEGVEILLKFADFNYGHLVKVYKGKESYEFKTPHISSYKKEDNFKYHLDALDDISNICKFEVNEEITEQIYDKTEISEEEIREAELKCQECGKGGDLLLIDLNGCDLEECKSLSTPELGVYCSYVVETKSCF